ncbi:hypothetical protein Tsubulata_048200 [Turnera subulata]|uniref:DUF569 domain-containing protein n=1 Tax=Turnera subulata TaxID=218843 RepID=A0A9Q0F632_9ROSI|nr:hypothetical protein Tsubulata_048200 [Turnera subulata]
MATRRSSLACVCADLATCRLRPPCRSRSSSDHRSSSMSPEQPPRRSQQQHPSPVGVQPTTASSKRAKGGTPPWRNSVTHDEPHAGGYLRSGG